MKILQLTSDWKWTGPAQPMLLLARALRERGHTVELACPEAPPGQEGGVAAHAGSAGLPPVWTLEPARGIRPLRDGRDARRLRALLLEGGYDLVHAWHSRDHGLAVRAAGLPERGRRAAVVRSWRKADALPASPWNRWLFGPGTDGLLCVSAGSARANASLRQGRPVVGALGAVELGRYAAGPADPRLRESLDLGAGDRVVGIVARAQRHRRFELLLDALARVVAVRPDVRLLVVGRGTHLDDVVRRPAERRGLSEHVRLAGYRTDDYVQVLRAMDLFTFLVPGSDGTCRALLEAAACGLPAVTSRRGALPEIVSEGESGLLVDEDPAALAETWLRLLNDDGLRRRLAAGARARAEKLFTPERLAGDVESLYRAALEHVRQGESERQR